MNVEVKFRVVRDGKSDSYPFESSDCQYSIDGKKWYSTYNTPFDALFPKELLSKAYDYKIKKYETKIFEL